MMRKLGFTGLVAILALGVAAGSASAQTMRGTVVHRNARAHSFVVANARGGMSAIHSRRGMKPGRIVSLNARRLRNGTFALRSAHVLGRTRHARLRGTVTFVKHGAFVVSSRGASVLVKDDSSSGQPPSVGQNVQVDGTIDDQGDINEQDVNDLGDNNGNMDLEGVVLGVDQTARTLTISADDDNQSGASVTVDVPTSFDITKFAQGQEVELIVSPNGDGTFTLAASSEDGDSNQANSQGGEQGDDNNQSEGNQNDQSEQEDGGQQQAPPSGGSGNPDN